MPADEQVRAALTETTDGLIGPFVVAAMSYADDGSPRMMVHASQDSGTVIQIGLLQSALNRINGLDTAGWMDLED